MRDAQQPDKSIIELHALLASYKERLSRTSNHTPDSHAARTLIPEPLFLINDLVVDLRSSALENAPVVDSPGIVDCFKPDEPEPLTCVYKVKNGDPPEEIAFAWAEFSDIVLVFPTDTGSEVRLLS